VSDFKDTVAGTGAKAVLGHDLHELGETAGIQFAVLFEQARRHGAFGAHGGVFREALALHGVAQAFPTRRRMVSELSPPSWLLRALYSTSGTTT
jgi:hypothetical protein